MTHTPTLRERLHTNPLLWLVPMSFVLTGATYVVGLQIQRDDLLPDAGAPWYYWQLPEPTVWTRASAWTGYVLHQLSLWGLIYYAQTRVGRWTDGLHRINVVALLTNLGFILLHLVQSWIFYDGLAQDVSIFSSQGSVVLLLVAVLLMENKRRGLFFGRKAPLGRRVVDFARRYHGYLFSWAIVYTFWYHPAEITQGHLIGFFYMYLLLTQGSLFFTRSHTNRWWTFSLEIMVAAHGALVAYMQAGPTGFWPMFAFGFLGIFVLTQLHGLGLSVPVRTVVTIGYAVAVAGTYTFLRGWDSVDEIVRIPVIEYALVFVLALLIWLGLRIGDVVRRVGGGSRREREGDRVGA